MKLAELRYSKQLGAHLIASSDSVICKQLASEIDYQVSPLFGAKKKKARLKSELVTLETAMIIFAVNQRFDTEQAKRIIDPFLDLSVREIMEPIEKANANLKRIYTERMTEYFRILHQEKAVIALTFAFMRHLDINPLGNLNGQVMLAARLSTFLRRTYSFLDATIVKEYNPIANFEKEIAHWPANQAVTALQLVIDALDGQSVNREEHGSPLTLEQLQKVYQLLKGMGAQVKATSSDAPHDLGASPYEFDPIEFNANLYHEQIDALIDATYKFVHASFHRHMGSNRNGKFGLKTLSVFTVHGATLIAIARDGPELDRATLNGFSHTLAYRTENTMPNTKPPADAFVSYCSEEESFMHQQTALFLKHGVEPMVQNLLTELGGKPEDYELLSTHLHEASQRASKTFLKHLSHK